MIKKCNRNILYRVFIKYCVFSELCFPSVSAFVHTLTTEGKQRKATVRNIFKNSEKKTQYLMNTLYLPDENRENHRLESPENLKGPDPATRN